MKPILQLSKVFKVLQRYPALKQTFDQFTALQTQIVNRPRSSNHQIFLSYTCHAFKNVKNGIDQLYQGQPQILQILDHFRLNQYHFQYTNKYTGLMKELPQKKQKAISQSNFGIYGQIQNKIPQNSKNKNSQINKTNQDIQKYKLRIKVNNVSVEKRDIPFFRGTFYFHQIKDMHKHMRLPQENKLTPHFMQDITWKTIEQAKLDRKNPLGIPFHAPRLDIEIFYKKLWFRLDVFINQIRIKQIGTISKEKQNSDDIIIDRPRKRARLNKQSLNKNIQEGIFKFIKQELKLDDQQFLKIHKLAYISGQVQQINFYMDFFELMLLWDNQLNMGLQAGKNIF